MAKRIHYEIGDNEEDYVVKCMKCKHSYTRVNESDTLYCSLKVCRFEEFKKQKQQNKGGTYEDS